MKSRKAKPQDCWLKLKGLYVRPKAAFDSKVQAESLGTNQRAYLCATCGKWHLTSKRQS